MEGQQGLGNGARVAIIGGGVSGAAMAAAMLVTARSRGRNVEVRVFEGNRDELEHRPPVVLSAECRSRLAALGCRVPPEWKQVVLNGVEVISGRNRTLLRGAPGGLWVVDAWPEGLSGRTLVSRALASVAALHGAKFIPRRVDRVELAARNLADPAPQAGPGSLVIWSGGANERAHTAVLAAGADAPIAERFFDGFEGAPSVSAAHARLTFPPFALSTWSVAKLILAPLPGVDAVYLIPCRSSIYALALGPNAAPADLCQALMMATRDGHLPDGFEIAHLSSTRVPAGVGKRLCAPGQLAVGPAALGHPLQLGLSESLASCSRAAIALVDAASEQKPLRQRYVVDGISDLVEDARAATRAMKWLSRAGERGALAFERAHEWARQNPNFASGVLALTSPPALMLQAKARWAAFAHKLGAWWRTALEPMPPSLPQVERELYYVVDDDPVMRQSLVELLESRGAEVVSFGDELALFSAVARRPPAAILLDVVLNWVDGLRLCEELKRHPLTRHTRVVMMSGLNRPHIRERALKAGAEAFLPKPVSPERLLRSLDPLTQHESALDAGANRPLVVGSPRFAESAS